MLNFCDHCIIIKRKKYRGINMEGKENAFSTSKMYKLRRQPAN